MIGTFIRHGGLSSKVKVLYGRRLTIEDFLELLKKKSVGEIASYLKETDAYSEALSGINEKLVHRGQLENVLKRKLFEDHLKLFRFANGSDKTTLGIMFFKYEIEQLLSFLRFLKADIQSEFLYSIPEYLIDHASVDFVKISKTINYKEFLESIENSKYYNIFKRYSDIDNVDFSELETLLYSYYYTNLYSVVLPLYKGDMKEQLGSNVGSQIDLMNLIRIVRLKKYYKLKNDEIKVHILPFYYKLKKGTIFEMLQCESSDEVLEIIKKTPYEKLFNEHKNTYIDQYLYNFISKFSKVIMSSGKPSVNVPVAYLNLKDIEIKNIISIVEGKRYNMSVEEIKKHLLAFPSI